MSETIITSSARPNQGLLALGLEAPVGFAALPRKHQRFVTEFLQSGNPTKAAEAAGYASPTARGCELRKNPSILAVIEQALRISGATPERNVARIEEAALYWHAQAMEEKNGEKARRAAAVIAQRYATLLASIHGKLTLNVSSSVRHEERISVEVVHRLAEGRQRVFNHEPNGVN
ncbi:MAG: terminase small subunit [Verrucomicrobiales bacterium]|jgi:phage terminase small subunit|nr:terminase small subunit [Verrucomicrobiales bacterium]